MKEYVITERNKDNSEFYIEEKVNFETNLINPKSRQSRHAFDRYEKESKIIEMMNNGIRFYTYSKTNSFTDVIVVDGHIKSIPNDSTEDNIQNLPEYK